MGKWWFAKQIMTQVGGGCCICFPDGQLINENLNQLLVIFSANQYWGEKSAIEQIWIGRSFENRSFKNSSGPPHRRC